MEQISFGFFTTDIGDALLAATPRGLCALRLCAPNHRAEKLSELQNDYPRAQFTEDAQALQPYIDQLIAFLGPSAEPFTPTLDLLDGTAFQREVWTEMQKLAPGETVSYSELATQIGRPAAVRAVAQACARNGLAIAIPCHRVVRRDGSLAGFRWGLDWKRQLLALEARMAGAGGSQ